MTSTGPPRPEEIDAAERCLDVTLPQDYRSWLLATGGEEKWFGEVYLALFTLEDVLAVTEAADAQDRLPGFVAIGSDGGGELFAFDVRTDPPPVVMINGVCAGWHEGLLQAGSFTEFLAQRAAGQPLRWTRGYA